MSIPDRDNNTMAEYGRYIEEQHEIVVQRKALDARRREYLDKLIEAAHGDLTVTFGEARRLLGDSSDDA